MKPGPWRTATGGVLVDRSRPQRFAFDGRTYRGFAGDSLASALLANGVRLVGRSFKYHRPRGIFGLGPEEPNALLTVGTGTRTEPNTRATTLELVDGLVAESQNRFGPLAFDAAQITGLFAPLLPAGFYYKTFMWPPSWWTRYERHIRRMAGLGEAPREADPDRYVRRNAHCDLLVVGGGPAGLAAALAAGRTGLRVILADERPRLGGSLLDAPATIGDAPALDWVDGVAAELAAMPNLRVLTRTATVGAFDHGMFTLDEKIRGDGPRRRYWHVRARRAIFATGAIERPIAFAGNDRPGVMLASAVRGYLHRYGVVAGRRAVLFGNNDSIYAAARELVAAGADVAAIVDTRPLADVTAARDAPARVIGQAVVSGTGGFDRLRVATIYERAGDGLGRRIARLACDLLAVSGGWQPSLHLHAQSRGRMRWDEDLAAVLPDGPAGDSSSAGAAAGRLDLAEAMVDGWHAGADVGRELGRDAGAADLPDVETTWTPPGAPVWAVPKAGGGKRFVDLQNDVTVEDIALAAREGYRSVEHLKRYTTLGMGTDQGKSSNVAGLALLARETGRAIAEVGTTTFRPPYTPVTMNAIAAGEHGEVGHALRRTAADALHAERGAPFVDAAGWRRPHHYPVEGRRELATINDEATAVRNAVGMVDVSTLGKIELHGPDVPALLDLLYTNGWQRLAVGRGRYGVMLREDGKVFDDGVTMRLGERHYLLTCTTGNAGGVYRHIEHVLQVLRPDLRVFATPVTEQWFAVAVNGPRARDVLTSVTDADLSATAFPMMAVRDEPVAGIPARIMRVSYSGELGYEIHVPADYGRALWQALIAAGAPFGLRPYGVEAMATLRIEKGHVTHAEADGRTTPGDLGMAKLLSSTKDFVGRRSLSLPAAVAADRKTLVGLKAIEAGAVFPFGGQVVAEDLGDTPRESLGHVTSHAWSPTLDRHIGLALVKDGQSRLGQRLYVTSPVERRTVAVEVVALPFYDPEGARAHG